MSYTITPGAPPNVLADRQPRASRGRFSGRSPKNPSGEIFMTDHLQAQARTIIEQPIAALVALGLEGGDRAACRLLAFQYVLRLADDVEALMELRREIDDALQAARAAGGLH
jgi:hypothetical protein